MNLTKNEAKEICKRYNLGKVVSLKPFSGGAVNYNFQIITEKGTFVIKILGFGFNKWIRSQLKLSFKIIDFLNKNNFEYKITTPLANKYRNKTSMLNGKYLWAYKEIEGKIKGKPSEKDSFEAIRAIAKYHKLISKLDHSQDKKDYSWLLKEYQRLEGIKIKTPEDKLFKENLEDFKKFLEKFVKINFNENVLANHADFHIGNLIFKEKKVMGIIDFDNIEYSPRINDLVQLLKRSCIKNKTFDKSLCDQLLQEYSKILNLTKEEKRMVPYFMMLHSAKVFWWTYAKMKKDKSLREKYLKSIVSQKKILNRLIIQK